MSALTASPNPNRRGMSKDVDATSVYPESRIDIWGSCVSRDTLEFMPEYEVGAYIARQSAIVALCPAAELPVPLDALESLFQRRMLEGDMQSDAGDRIAKHSAVCVLVDLVDERRGVWKFPNGTYLTNSVEAFRTGIDVWGPEMDGRLIEFGTDEHFELWKQGFTIVTRRIRATKKPIVLLDIAWAEVFEGQTRPRGLASYLSATRRRGQRKVRNFLRTIDRYRSIKAGVKALSAPVAAPGDEYMRVAREANADYRRYIEEAESHVDATIRRTADAVRMKKSHKWGIGPYHYSDNDYWRISDLLCEALCGV